MGRDRSLGNRIDDSYNDRESGGGKGKQLLDLSKAGKVSFYKAEAGGGNKIDIIPYEITTKNHPRVKLGKNKVGDLDYLLDVEVHRNVGPQKATVICPKKMFGTDCPICRLAGEMWEAGKEKEAKNTWPKRRVFYNVIDANKPEEGLKIFETSHALFESDLLVAAKTENDDGTMVPFADPDEGSTIRFVATEAEIGKSKYFKFSNFRFLDRKPIKDALIDGALDFSAYIKFYSSEELEALLYGAEEEPEEPDEEAPKKARTPAKKAEKDDDLLSDDEDEKPRRSKHKEEDEDDTPTCPVKGLKFGVSIDEDDACDDCKLRKACKLALKEKRKKDEDIF